MNIIEELFGKPKAIIAMAHLQPLPGQPLHDAARGVRGLVEAARRDLEILEDSTVDGVLFCNEGDRPYRTKVGPETIAIMAAVVAELAPLLSKPFGVDILWDPAATIAVARATGARFAREVFTGVYGSDFGLWNTDPAESLRLRHNIGADDVRLIYNITGEFSAPLGARDIEITARAAIFSSLADAICLSGAITGAGVDQETLRRAKSAAGETPVIVNTGATPGTIGEILALADGVIVGTALKREGITWNPIDPARVHQLVEAAERSGHWHPGAAVPVSG